MWTKGFRHFKKSDNQMREWDKANATGSFSMRKKLDKNMNTNKNINNIDNI